MRSVLVMMMVDNMTKEYFKFLNKYLATFDGAADDADAISAAKEEAAAAIVEFVKSSDLYQVLLLHLRLRACVRAIMHRFLHTRNMPLSNHVTKCEFGYDSQISLY